MISSQGILYWMDSCIPGNEGRMSEIVMLSS